MQLLKLKRHRIRQIHLLVCNWPHSVGQNHFIVKMFFIRDSAIQKYSRRFCTVCKSRKSGSLPAVRTTSHTLRTLIRLKHHSSGRRGFPSGLSSLSRSFELLQLASVRTIQQPVRTILNVRSSLRISFQTQIQEDCCNRPDDMDSCPTALLLKASLQFKLNCSNASLPWFGRAYDRYENCM